MSAPVDVGWMPDIGLLTERMTAFLQSQGHPWPELAAAVLRDRGQLGLDRAAYAAMTGVSLRALAALEDGKT